MNVQSTKAIARKVGLTVAQVNETARDLGIDMNYRKDNRYWEITNRHEAKMFLQHLVEHNG